MEEKQRKNKRPAGVSGAVENRNIRSISNSREVSRRSKGKNRYPYEENMRTAARYYGEDRSQHMQRRNPSSQGAQGNPSGVKKADAQHSAAYDKYQSSVTRRKERDKYRVSRAIGILMAIIQFILSVILVVNVLFLGMLTNTYLLVLVSALVILLGATLLTQIGARKKGIPGKVFCGVLCVVLGFSSFYINQINSAIRTITGNSSRTSSMVVAVRSDDSAQKLEDIRDYTLGVQYAVNGDQVESTLRTIEKELSTEMNVQEFDGVLSEVESLRNGEVDAIIYNSNQTGIVKDQIPTFSDDVRIIYTHDIVVEIENEVMDASVSEPFAIYLSGMDTYNEVSSADRSDVNIIGVVNPQTHQVLLVTTPRDYWVPIPGISDGIPDKLTHAGIYGVEASMRTLEELYDVDLQFYGRINFSTLIKIVDTLGGLDVESDLEFDTGSDSGAEIHVNEGMNHFGGVEALAFCRERHAIADGDNARGRHQQAVITAMINKLMSPALLRSATEIIETVSDGVDTNFSMEQIQSLIKTQLRTGASWEIISVQAEGIGDKQPCFSSGSQPLSVYLPIDASVNRIRKLIDRVENGEMLDKEKDSGNGGIDESNYWQFEDDGGGYSSDYSSYGSSGDSYDSSYDSSYDDTTDDSYDTEDYSDEDSYDTEDSGYEDSYGDDGTDSYDEEEY